MLKIQKRLLTHFRKNLGKINSWSNVPISNKEVIRKSPVPARFSELRITSGSTGNPLYIFYSKEAVEAFIKRTVTSLKKSNVTSKDVVLNLFAYGNYVPGSMYEKACQKEKISVIPLGAPNSYPKEKVLDAIVKIRPNVWFSIPSYAVSLIDTLSERKQHGAMPKKVIVAGEKLLESYIKKFRKYHIEVVNHFGLTECPAIGVSKAGNPKAIEIINDGIYTESIEEDGVKYFVVTDLYNLATPIIRYKTGDVIRNTKHNKDGSLSEISIIGRADDLVKIQGVLTSKTKIINTLLKFTDKFYIKIKTRKGRDLVEIAVDQAVKKLRDRIDEDLGFVKRKELVFKKRVLVPKTSSYKARYIADLRR